MGTKYATVSISGYNSSAPADDGTQTAANQVKWSTIKTKLPDPLKTAIEAINSQLVTYSDFGVRQVSTNDSTTAADYMKTVEVAPGVSTSVTVSLGDAASMTAGYIVTVKNSSAITQTVGRATAGNTINGSAFDFSLPPKASVKFKVIGAETGYIVESFFGNAEYDPVDHRKIVVWDASGVSAGSPRTVTVQNENGTMALTSEFTYSNVAGSNGRMVFPRMWISGLTYSRDTDTDHDTAIAAGEAMDDTNAQNMILSAVLTKRIDAAWAVGDDQGGLDGSESVAGTPDANTWYYIWLIKRSDTGVVDALYSESASAPTMPTNYDYKRLIGAVLTDGSANIVAYTTYELMGGGLEVLWSTPTLDIDLTNTLTTSRRTDAVKVPLSFSTIAHLNVRVADASTVGECWIYCPDQDDSAPSETAAPLANIEASPSGTNSQLKIRTSSAGLIAARSNLATVDSYRVSTIGWEWSRR